ncbi:MAG: AAA domain-containing protein [Dehalococcoidia bacterium]
MRDWSARSPDDNSERADAQDVLQEEAVREGIKLPDSVAGFSERRVALVHRAVREWTHNLIDLGGRNNMLNYRDLKRGTLDLTVAEKAALSKLLEGKTTRISALIPGDEDRENALSRVRTIFKKASENFEERGIETLSLACGLATWHNPKSTWQPRAPVLIRRASLHPVGAAQEDFELTLLEDMEVSSVLVHVLRVEFECEVDQEYLFERIEGSIDETWELNEAYEWIAREANSVPGFSVEPRLVLANFAYTKLPMVRDLEGAFEDIVAHDLIAAIAGDEDAREAARSASPEPESVPSPDIVPSQSEFLILDADASQSYAINAVIAGANLIIRGPPGTGKSQTIANLIGSLAAQGKRTLFVAEKRAAIEAVLKRLRHEKLDDLVVDLHGGLGSRREFAQSIGRALDSIPMTPPVDNADEHRRLDRHREGLNRYAAALHDVREPWGLSAYQVRVQLMNLERSRCETRFVGEALTSLTEESARRLQEEIEEYVHLGGPHLELSPWATSTVASNRDVAEAYEQVRTSRQVLLPRASQLFRSTVAETSFQEPPSLNDWEPRLDLLDEVGKTLRLFTSAVFEHDLDDLCKALAPAHTGRLSRAWASLTSADYRRARRTLVQQLREAVKASDKELLDRCERARDQLRAWRSFSTTSQPSVPDDLDAVNTTFDELRDALEAVERWVGLSGLCDLPPSSLEVRLQALLADRATLVNLPDLKRLRASLSEAGLDEFLEEMEGSGQDWVERFRFSWLHSILDHISLNDRHIGGFIPDAHDKTVADFRLEDRSHIDATPGRIRRICAENAVAARSAYGEQDEIVRRQARLKRRHLPIRELIRSAGDVLLALKPCWAMSPLVVSQLLPTKAAFDVVIFDEASQITPADAISSILRGRQLVVAGDERQLPPSAFFVAEGPEDEEPDDDELNVPIVAGTKGFESILDALADLLRPRMLQWHYRSRDERLIAFSNAHIYDRMLTTFPGSRGGEEVLGHVLAPWDPATDTNSPAPEVNTVVDLIVEHFRARQAESLGVIAMGIKHANRIEEALLQRLRDDPNLEEELSDVLDPEREERFFIKNLERVQGDERDAIILTVGYGKNARGDLPYHFGPLLQEGGERRLNVAVTRAKNRMTLVSSFSAHDMAPGRSDAEGVKLLRDYLQYMESLGQNLGDRVMEKPALNPFEADVRDTLTRHGLRLVPQYGTSGYWIDFAVQHPERPGDYVLALECDGATYHSSQSARDRDRLRQEQLERLGWRFCRIWSGDWFANKESAVKKVLSAYGDALAADAVNAPPIPKRREASEREAGHAPAPLAQRSRNGPRPRTYRWQSVQNYSLSELVRLVRWIESDGILRTEDELMGEVMEELGFQRRGKRVVSRIAQAIREARREQAAAGPPRPLPLPPPPST